MEYIGKKMVVDTPGMDGGVYFFEDYFEFRPRDTYSFKGKEFKVFYKDIIDMVCRPGIKSTVIITLNDNKNLYFNLYKRGTFMELVQAGRDHLNKDNNKVDIDLNNEKETNESISSVVDALERLSKLYESGAITKEEYDLLKEKAIKGE